MRLRFLAAAVGPLLLCCAPAFGQDAPVPPTQETPQATPTVALDGAATCCVAVTGTLVDIQVTASISTKTARRGDKFAIRLAAPLVVGGKTLLPEGVTGVGEVIHAAAPSMGGKPGELLLAARYLEFNGRQIPLKGMRLGRIGQDNATAIMTASVLAPIVALIPITGGHVELPSGSRAQAKLASDLTLPPLSDAPTQASAPVPTPVSPP